MPDVTIDFDELESGDLPPVCMACEARRGVDFVERRFVHEPLFAPPGLSRMLMTKRVSAVIPLCREHGGPRLVAHRRFAWWGLKTVAVAPDRITIGRVHEDFAEALRRWRMGRDRGEIDEPPPRRRRRVQTGRGPGGGMAALKVLGILTAVMAALAVVMVLGMFVVMGLWVATGPRFLPAPGAPGTPAAPPAAVAPTPEGVVVGLFGAAPQAGGPGALPWAPLALAARKATFHLLDDAELDKALADLKSANPSVVAAAARRLTQAAPAAGRRKEAAQALQEALANPFPTAKNAAAEALGVWGTADDVPALIAMLDDPDPGTRAAAMNALAALKDERGAVFVARRLGDFFDREKAAQALKAMGPVAEKPILPTLNGADAPTRVAACGVLAAVGTKECLPALEQAARGPDRNVALAAADAVRAIRARP